MATTTNTVMTGCARISHRQRLLLAVITAQATSTDQHTWTDGMADSWSAPTLAPAAP
ncbi:MAG TPA: hypothetical protein VHZ33_14620 [Trebonia sp.]|nr:hypothetical protein [Trebonia sp.]